MVSDNHSIAARLRDVFFSYDRQSQPPEGDSTPTSSERAADGVLKSIDLDIPEGAFTVILGPSGGGKSTLLRTFNAIIPDFITGSFEGSIEVLNQDTTQTRVSDMATDVGFVLQDYESQLFATSIESELAFGPENIAVPPDEIAQRVSASAKLVGLDHLDRSREPADLSGGQKQRLVCGGVAAMHPQMLLLDEPTSDLDPKGTGQLLAAIRSLTGTELGTRSSQTTATSSTVETDWGGPETMVMVTHDITEALHADYAVILADGKITDTGPADQLLRSASTLRERDIAVPQLVDIFDRLGVPTSDLPLFVPDAIEVFESRGMDWNPEQLTVDGTAPAGTGSATGEVQFTLNDVSFSYESASETIPAVDDVSFQIEAGEVIALIGHNGSGKTTLAKQLNGLLTPDSGSVQFEGRDVSTYSMSEIGQSVGFVFQNPDHQIFANTVRKEVEFGPRNFDIQESELQTRVDSALQTVGLSEHENADPFNLSKGQRQRVALASILATHPRILIFDEPTTGLDAAQRDSFMSLITRLNQEENLTVIMITHSMQTVARYAPRSIVLRDGSIVYDGSTRALFADIKRLEMNNLRPPPVVNLAQKLSSRSEKLSSSLPLSVHEFINCVNDTVSTRK